MHNRNWFLKLIDAVLGKQADNINLVSDAMIVMHKRKKFAGIAWIYILLISVATVMLGTFVVAFLASIKDDPLENPFSFNFAQIRPSNWKSAYDLGKQGNNAPFFGGFAPNSTVKFSVTYVVEEGKTLTEPKVIIPRKKAGTGAAAIAARNYAADYAVVSPLRLVKEEKNVSFTEKKGNTFTEKQGHSGTWEFSVSYDTKNKIEGKPFVVIRDLPMDIAVPKGQILLKSTIAPNKIVSLGKIAKWENISPGVIGYVFRNYVRVYTDQVNIETGESLFLGWMFNSFTIAIGKVLLTLFFACTAGYALARLKFTGVRFIVFLMLVSMMIPMQVTFISNYLIYKDLGLLNTPWAVITMVLASGQVLIMKQFFESIPKELEEAALVDGATPPVILFRIFMPLAKPAIMSVTILGFQGAWNDFFWPLVVISSPVDAFTLPVGLLSLRNAYGGAGDWSLILAGAFLSTVPVLIVFIIFQRYFIGNDISSAVKG